MKKRNETIELTGLILFTIFCIADTGAVRSAVSGGMQRCLMTIIPSLFAVMTAVEMIIRSGIITKFRRLRTRLLVIFIMSMLGGYPVGTKLIIGEYESGRITKRQAELYSGVCYGAGPAFISGCISIQLYGNNTAGKVVFISNIAADIMLGLIVYILTLSGDTAAGNEKNKLSAISLTESIVSTGKTMAVICFTIIIFSVISAMIMRSGLITAGSKLISKLTGRTMEEGAGIILSVMDITSVNSLPANDYTLIPFLSAVTAFGGICVIFQLRAVTGGKISLYPVIGLRAAAGVLSYFIGRMIMPIYISGDIMAVTTLRANLHKAASPVPSILLIIMTAVVFREYSRRNGGSET